MNSSSMFAHVSRALIFAGVLGSVSIAAGQEKKAPAAEPKIVIQIDGSKIPPDILKKLIELSNTNQKPMQKEDFKKPMPQDEPKKPMQKEDFKKPAQPDEPKKPMQKEDFKKPAQQEAPKKPNIIQVDLNKLPPDLAKRLLAELGNNGDGKQKGNK